MREGGEQLPITCTHDLVMGRLRFVHLVRSTSVAACHSHSLRAFVCHVVPCSRNLWKEKKSSPALQPERTSSARRLSPLTVGDGAALGIAGTEYPRAAQPCRRRRIGALRNRAGRLDAGQI
jgi:hypothetical protein